MKNIKKSELIRIIKQALKEDIGKGDLTTDTVIPAVAKGSAEIIFKESGLSCGINVAQTVFKVLSKKIIFSKIKRDGVWIKANTAICRIEGDKRTILKGERVALNFIQRLSGIATLTRRFCDQVKGTGVRILDTRKTTPRLRALEKYAVSIGGGKNHRMGLFDGSIIKSNHLKSCSNLPETIRKIRERGAKFVEIEATTNEQVIKFMNLDIDVIMLDNFHPEQLADIIQMIRRHSRIKIEVSGGVTLENVRQIADCRPDFISVGSLTHSAPAIDVALQIT